MVMYSEAENSKMYAYYVHIDFMMCHTCGIIIVYDVTEISEETSYITIMTRECMNT